MSDLLDMSADAIEARCVCLDPDRKREISVLHAVLLHERIRVLEAIAVKDSRRAEKAEARVAEWKSKAMARMEKYTGWDDWKDRAEKAESRIAELEAWVKPVLDGFGFPWREHVLFNSPGGRESGTEDAQGTDVREGSDSDGPGTNQRDTGPSRAAAKPPGTPHDHAPGEFSPGCIRCVEIQIGALNSPHPRPRRRPPAENQECGT